MGEDKQPIVRDREPHISAGLHYAGDELLNAFQDTMLEFIRQSVPFLHKGSAVEIYSKFRSTIQHTQGHECYEALAWLAILLPTTELADDGDYWDTWFGEWMDLFESNASSEFWNFWWLDLFANVAKNDTKGKTHGTLLGSLFFATREKLPF